MEGHKLLLITITIVLILAITLPAITHRTNQTNTKTTINMIAPQLSSPTVTYSQTIQTTSESEIDVLVLPVSATVIDYQIIKPGTTISGNITLDGVRNLPITGTYVINGTTQTDGFYNTTNPLIKALTTIAHAQPVTPVDITIATNNTLTINDSIITITLSDEVVIMTLYSPYYQTIILSTTPALVNLGYMYPHTINQADYYNLPGVQGQFFTILSSNNIIIPHPTSVYGEMIMYISTTKMYYSIHFFGKTALDEYFSYTINFTNSTIIGTYLGRTITLDYIIPTFLESVNEITLTKHFTTYYGSISSAGDISNITIVMNKTVISLVFTSNISGLPVVVNEWFAYGGSKPLFSIPVRVVSNK